MSQAYISSQITGSSPQPLSGSEDCRCVLSAVHCTRWCGGVLLQDLAFNVQDPPSVKPLMSLLLPPGSFLGLGWAKIDLAGLWVTTSVQFGSVAQSCQTLCYPMNLSTPGLPIHHQLLAAAAAAESLQSCPTLCGPIDGSPPG